MDPQSVTAQREESLAARIGGSAPIAFAVLIAASLIIGLLFMEPKRPQFDAIRYLSYAINLHDHGVFSRTGVGATEMPAPGSTHVPLYPAWLAAFMAVDPGLRDTFLCYVQNQSPDVPCAGGYTSIIVAQLVLAGILFGSVWLLARTLSGSVPIAWIAALCAMLARNPLQYANQLLTEALLIPLLAVFLLFLALALCEKRPRWMIAAGLTLGLAALTRPAYAYLFLAMTAVLAVAGLVRWRRPVILGCLLFALSYGVVVAPWLARNKALHDRAALTTVYAGDILSQRVAYNRMTWREFGIAFPYWFPDFGDKLARMVGTREDYERLRWHGDGTFYEDVAPEVYAEALREAGGPDRVVGYLVRTEILGDPFKHTLVSLPLAWRATFISKYWGMAGFLCFVALILIRGRSGDHRLLLLSLPVWFMVAFHALVSVSIPRYNLALIPIYAYAMAWVIDTVGRSLFAMVRQKKYRRVDL